MSTRLSLVADRAGRAADYERDTSSADGIDGVDPLAARPGIGITVHYQRGQTIVVEGDPTGHYYKVIGGTLRRYQSIADGRRQVIDFLQSGDYFGLTELGHHADSVEAITPATLVRIPRTGLEAACHRDPSLTRWLYHLACHELARAQRQMLVLGRKTAEERVASFLLGLADTDADRGVRTGIHLPMSRLDIADYLGLTIETVSRTLSRLNRDGLIRLDGRHQVVFEQPERLRALASGATDLDAAA